MYWKMNKRPFPVIPRKFRFVAWFAAIIGLLVAVMGFYDFYRDARLVKIGTRVEGAIESFQTEPSTKGREIYKFEVTWRDEAKNIKYRKNFSTSSARWPDGPPKEKVTVIYDLNHPKRSEIGENFQPDSEPIALGTFMGLLGILAVSWLRYSSKKNLEWVENELK